MEKWYKVFISSTIKDLTTERNKVKDMLLRINCIPIAMEYFPSTGEHQWQIISRCIKQCDYFILILAGCYGTINTTGVGGEQYKGMGFTEMEYNYAAQNCIPIIAFLRNNCNNLPASKIDAEISKQEKLKTFKDHLKNNVYVEKWSSADHLCTVVSTSLHQTISLFPRPGLLPPSVYEDRQQNLMKNAEDQHRRDLAQIKKLTDENFMLLNEVEQLYQLSNYIYVYTKDNKRLTIERNATALDFAFKIHPMVGLCAKAIYVTSMHSNYTRLVSFGYTLHAGDKVTVISDSGKNGTPRIVHASPQWVKHLRTSSAKRYLNHYFQQL